MMWLWLGALLLVPLVGVVAVCVFPARRAKWIALAASTATFLHSIIVAVAFEHWHDGGFGFGAAIPKLQLPKFGIHFEMGVDSVALLLTLLTTLLMPLCIWGSFSAIKDASRSTTAGCWGSRPR